MRKINKIGLGTVQFGLDYGISNSSGKTANQEIEKILNYAKTVGINTLDTASAYGNAEEVIGTFEISHFNIVSKFINGAVGEQYRQSLDKLKHSKLYGFLAHRPLELLNDTIWEDLLKLKYRINLKVGYSLNDLTELEQLLEKDRWPDLVQIPYNILDKRFEKHFKILKEKGCEIHSRSTFLQGLFFCDVKNLNPNFAPIKDYIVYLQKDKQLAASLLNYSLSNENIDKVIVGVNTFGQLKENVEQIKTSSFANIEPYPTDVSLSIIQPSKWKLNE